jgi:hypothetical protein
MGNKCEIGWKRVNNEGQVVQVFARRRGGEWIFFQRSKRYEQWQKILFPEIQDWLILLDSVERRIKRRLFPPKEAELIKKKICELFPEFNKDQI